MIYGKRDKNEKKVLLINEKKGAYHLNEHLFVVNLGDVHFESQPPVGGRYPVMSKKKILSIAFIVVVVAIITAFYFYSQPENKYIWNSAFRAYKLSRVTKKVQELKLCSSAENKAQCFNSFVLNQGGYEFSVDIPAYFINSFTVCGGETQSYCVYEVTDSALNNIAIENLWISKSIPHSDKKFNDLFNLELDTINKMLRVYRQKLTDYYAAEMDPARKLNALNFLKLVDGKIQLVQRSRLVSP